VVLTHDGRGGIAAVPPSAVNREPKGNRTMSDTTKPRTIQVTEALLYKGEHREPGEIITMPLEDAAACVTAGRAKLLTEEEAAAAEAAARKAAKQKPAEA
jgi:hypothetical protein